MHEQYLIFKGSRVNIAMNQQQNTQQENQGKRTA